jgi:hypothetical protein
LTGYGIIRHILSNSMHLIGAGDNYTQSSYRIHPCPSDFYLWLKKNYRGFNKT